MMNEKTSATFRKLERETAAQIVDIHGDAFDEDAIRYSVFASPRITAFIAALFDESAHEFTGAYIDDELAGYAHVRLFDGQPHLNYIAVKENRQAIGIGSELMLHLLDRATSGGYRQFTLDVPENNNRVRRWYAKVGFKDLSSTCMFVAEKTTSRLPGKDEIEVSYADQQLERLNKYGIAECKVEIAGVGHSVGVVGEKLFRVGADHDQQLLSALQAVDPMREIMIIIPSEAELNGSARFIDKSIRMVRAL